MLMVVRVMVMKVVMMMRMLGLVVMSRRVVEGVMRGRKRRWV
jgi:hypothetical protein